jgi:excinuclease UvrABC nuclease subunit
LPSIAEILATPTIAPTQPGVYFLLRRGKIVYVGQSKNPLFRIGQHATRLKFDAFAVLPCAMEDLLVFEGAFILKFRPRYNKNGL